VSTQPLIVISGPTASGKTAQAIRVAHRVGAEIISADSQQVYGAFDIGTAKPSREELSQIPHHLIDVADPSESFSAARFQQLSDAAISDIQDRGKRVVVAGGTGLYLRVLLHGVVPAPPGNPTLRAMLEAEAEHKGREALWSRLYDVDPDSARKIHKTDLVRIVRALEIHELTGTPASELRRAHGFAPDRHAFRMFVLDPPREELYASIDTRTRKMFEQGLVEEVRSLLFLGHREAAPMASVGYLQALAHVEGRLTLEEAITEAARETRRYAKRQLTWFRREPGAVFIQPPYKELEELE
jgi:tRNA dimethylallyltransferase